MKFQKKSGSFFDRPIPEEVRNPFIHNLTETAEFIKEYIKKYPDCRIVIVGDYDSDGLNATSILYWMFSIIHPNVTLRIPHRLSEGYGLSEKIVNETVKAGDLLITVDNGISAINAVKLAKRIGCAVVVIDHHLPAVDAGEIVLPDAVILDPKVEPEKSEFTDYCGSALAYRLAKEMLPNMNLTQLLVQAAIATITDVMPLTGANYTLVKDALPYINKRMVVPGLAVLIDKLQMGYHISESDFGFKLGPALNAPGRLYDSGADFVLDLLTASKNDAFSEIRADRIIEANKQRKEAVTASMKYMESAYNGSRPIVLYSERLHPGLVGLIAGQFCEKYHSPAIVFTDTEDPEVIKGSGRSIPEINLKQVLDSIQDKTLQYGGHAGAAGLSVKKSLLSEFAKAFREAVGVVPEPEQVIYYDEELTDFEETFAKLSAYAPFGEGNPKPLFHLVYTPESKVRFMGDGNHISFTDSKIKIVGFNMADEYKRYNKRTLNMVGHLSEDWYNKRTIQFEIKYFA